MGTSFRQIDPRRLRNLSEANSAQDFLRTFTEALAAQFEAPLLISSGLYASDGSALAEFCWPVNVRPAGLLAEALERCRAQKTAIVIKENNFSVDKARSVDVTHVLYPHSTRTALFILSVTLADDQPVDVEQAIIKLQWSAGWLILFNQNSNNTAYSSKRVPTLRDELNALVLKSAYEQSFTTFSLTLLTGFVERLGCDQCFLSVVSNGRPTAQLAVPGAALNRRSEFAQEIEQLAAEAIYQDSTIVWPAPDSHSIRSVLIHRQFSRTNRDCCLLTVPLYDAGYARYAVTFARRHENPFDALEVEAVGVSLNGATHLMRMYQQEERILSGYLVHQTRSFFSKLISAGYSKTKLLAAAVILFLVVVSVIQVDFRVTARASLKGVVQRTVTAPVAGFIKQSFARAGETVKKDQVIATLDDRDLVLERQRLEMEVARTDFKLRQAFAASDRSAVAIASAERQQASAQFKLNAAKLERLTIKAPEAGVILSGDLSQMAGSPVSEGQSLFEIAPLRQYRVTLKVEEDDISYLQLDQTGALTLSSLPNAVFPVTVTHIGQVSLAADGVTAFEVEAAMPVKDVRLRPGMEGIAKIKVGKTSLAWSWSRSVVEGIALWLFARLP